MSQHEEDQAVPHMRVIEEDLHPHLKARMQQPGVTRAEIERALNEGWDVTDAKSGTLGKAMVFPYHAVWEGKFYNEKEVTVYYKKLQAHHTLLTVKSEIRQELRKRCARMKIDYDADRDLLYVWFGAVGTKAAQTVTVTPGVHADFDARGKLIGFEVLDATEVLGNRVQFEVALPEAGTAKG